MKQMKHHLSISHLLIIGRVLLILFNCRRSRFESTKEEVFKAFKNKYVFILPFYVSNIKTAIPKHSSEYSTLYYWRNPKTNSQSFFGYNMCFNPMTAEIFFHLPHNEHFDRNELRGGKVSLH